MGAGGVAEGSVSKSTIDTSTNFEKLSFRSATSWDNGCNNAKMHLLF